MKYTKSNITRLFCSSLLMLALLLPASIQIIHSFENHDHPICKFQGKLHLHESAIDCELCDFNFSLTVYSFQDYEDNILIAANRKQITHYRFLSCNTKLHFKQLRGPPATS